MVLLDPGEANLPKQSVVVVSQVSSIEKNRVGAPIGTLSPQRVEQSAGAPRLPATTPFGSSTGQMGRAGCGAAGDVRALRARLER